VLWNQLSQIWRPAIEITILAVGFYYALVLIRGTRGWAVITGFLILLLALTLISTGLNLQVLTWILRTFLAFSVVAVLVLFQPEMRHILAELGHRPLLGTAREQRENIEVIIQAASRLSEMRIGALIAFERSIQLQEVVESGLVVDCEATPEMLETIFFPNNAIHDGGVIIRANRILYAACIFPLTQRQNLQKSLGTRHRAAIGLSEETDAVVVAVSEETGAISHAFRGQLVRGVSIEELRAFLTSIFIQRSTPRTLAEWFRHWWRSRWRRRAPAEASSHPR